MLSPVSAIVDSTKLEPMKPAPPVTSSIGADYRIPLHNSAPSERCSSSNIIAFRSPADRSLPCDPAWSRTRKADCSAVERLRPDSFQDSSPALAVHDGLA